MATHQLPLMGWATQPDGSGDAYFDLASNELTTARYDHLVLVFRDVSTKIEVPFNFVVPQNYVGTATFRCLWSSDITSNDWEFDIEYRSIAVGEDVDPTTDQETLNVADTAPGTAWDLQEAVLTPTASNFAAGDLVVGKFGRDGSDVGDTLIGSVTVFGLVFQYSDA